MQFQLGLRQRGVLHIEHHAQIEPIDLLFGLDHIEAHAAGHVGALGEAVGLPVMMVTAGAFPLLSVVSCLRIPRD